MLHSPFFSILLLILGVFLGFVLYWFISRKRLSSAETQANTILEEAKREIENKRRELAMEAKDKLYRDKQEFEEQTRTRRQELQTLEKRLLQKEETLERRLDSLDRREQELQQRDDSLNQVQKEVQQKQQKFDALIDEQKAKLEKISGMTTENAKKLLIETMTNEARQDGARLIKQIEEDAKENAERKAKRIITMAIQRNASDFTIENTISVVQLPNEEMKGRIIGREGRNIRALEQATGVDLIVDDTPEAVIISGFDIVRREVARVSLEKLLADGRIHPARIEDVVAKAKSEVELLIKESGEQAMLETSVTGLHPEIIRTLGRLRFRTSYGQNVLQHSIEVAHLAAAMAAELRTDINLAKRAGLLHDLGKAVDHEIEGGHAQIGADLATKYSEPPSVVHCIAAHHGEIEFQSLEAVLVQAADAISASRPGARRENIETYIKRLKKLEDISLSFTGVSKAYAIQAGRELRILVKEDSINDQDAILLAKDIAKKVEEELEYPGQIKVTVIRETRAVEYAK
ncbi:ribonuclease Y [candidate division FCPU426 bacterium]|nr:ribonuclease Y [candidate division FCPU426 bacterium]